MRSHEARDNYVSREANLKKIRMEYNHLKYFGYNARYEPDQFTKAEVAIAVGYLNKLKQELQSLI